MSGHFLGIKTIKMLPYRHIPVEKEIVKIVHELIAIQGSECS